MGQQQGVAALPALARDVGRELVVPADKSRGSSWTLWLNTPATAPSQLYHLPVSNARSGGPAAEGTAMLCSRMTLLGVLRCCGGEGEGRWPVTGTVESAHP